MVESKSEFVLTHEAGQILERTPDAVRAMARRGALQAVRVGHVRLFRRQDVERVARERGTRKKAGKVR